MKKFSIIALSVISTLTFVLGFIFVSKNNAIASEIAKTETEMFLPSSPIEFYDLNSPIAVSYSNDGYLIISEHYENADTGYTYNRITVYNPNTESYTVIPSHNTLSSISQIEKYGNYLYYVSESQIYYIPISNLTATPNTVKDSSGLPVIVANYFSFKDGKVVTNTNNTAVIYEITENENGPTFNKLYDFKTFAKAGFFAENGDIYLLDNGTLKYFRSSDKTNVTLTTINKDVISILDVGNYVWFTAIDGLYKIEKKENSEIELVIPITEGATTLGALLSPKGITIKDGNILIADSSLDCIQEIDTSTGKFTPFAITTESTADYRLTRDAESIILSENYVYALDNASFKSGDEKQQKRIVKVSKNKETYPYRKIDLTDLYVERPDLEIKFFTASDTHVMIYDGDFVSLYKQSNSSPITLEKVIEYQSASVTALNYLDGSFYYTDTSIKNYSYDVVNVHKITLPSENNELEEITTELLTNDQNEIKGVAVDFTIDIFGNIIIAYKTSETATTTRLTRLFKNQVSNHVTINDSVISLETDFSGNVYVLSNNNKIYKYIEINGAYTNSQFEIDTLNNETVKSLILNYRSSDCYYLGSACIYKNKDNNLQIKSLTGILANNVKENELLTDVKFVSLKENAKIFKVKLGDYNFIGENKYFKEITPVSNPNTTRIYTVIAEIDSDYLLLSYSNKFAGLIRKTSISSNGDATYITTDKYAEHNLVNRNLNGEKRYLSNNAQIYSKPIADDNYKLTRLNKGTALYAVTEYKFNKTGMTLVSLSENGAPIGYVVSGYLRTSNLVDGGEYVEAQSTIGDDASKQVTATALILLIAFTVTATLIFIESKLLFKEDKQ
ncbi:MAG: hypothetical protein J6Q38_06295 [Clostridia bacterium]|nr:hypothetical protein [Clostridia bacterium]